MAREDAERGSSREERSSREGRERPRRRRAGRNREDYPDRFINYRHKGNARGAVTELLDDNLGYRETFRRSVREGRIVADNERMARLIQDLEGEIADLTEELDGGEVLKGDDVKLWSAVKALNLTPEKLKERLDRADTLERESATSKRKDEARKAADYLEWDAELFAEFVADKGLEVLWKDVPVRSGKRGRAKMVAVPHLRKAGDEKADAVEAEVYVEKHHRLFLGPLQDGYDDADEDDLGEGSRDEGRDDEETDEGDEDEVDGEDEQRTPRHREARRGRRDRSERESSLGGRSGRRIPAQSKGGRTPAKKDVVGEHIKSQFVPPSKRNQKAGTDT